MNVKAVNSVLYSEIRTAIKDTSFYLGIVLMCNIPTVVVLGVLYFLGVIDISSYWMLLLPLLLMLICYIVSVLSAIRGWLKYSYHPWKKHRLPKFNVKDTVKLYFSENTRKQRSDDFIRNNEYFIGLISEVYLEQMFIEHVDEAGKKIVTRIYPEDIKSLHVLSG